MQIVHAKIKGGLIQQGRRFGHLPQHFDHFIGITNELPVFACHTNVDQVGLKCLSPSFSWRKVLAFARIFTEDTAWAAAEDMIIASE